jgi:integrase
MARPRKLNTHLPKYVTVIHGAYWYRPPAIDGVKQKPVRIGPQGEEHLVWRFMLTLKEPEATGPITLLRDCFDRYTREVLPTLAPRTQIDYARHVATLKATFGHMRPEELQPRHIGQFLDRPKGKIQANRQVAVLSAIFSKMVGRWYVCDKNPCQHVERNPAGKRTRYITDAEFDAVKAIAPIRVQIMMDLALLTGQRQGDLLALPLKNVTAEGILFKQGKTGKRLLVGISPLLQEVLDRAAKLLPQNLWGTVVRTSKAGGAPYTSEGFRALWQRVMSKALRLGVISERYTFHDIRAKCVSDTKNIQDAFERAGHTSMAMTRGTYDRGIRKVTPLK